jgi:predicted Zn-dependent protease with MMP-like domain
MGRREFEELMAETLDQLPQRFAELLENVVVQATDRPDRATLAELGLSADQGDELMGLYHGHELTGRGWDAVPGLPDVIVLYRKNLIAACQDSAELVREIQLTLLHEIGHHLGFSEEEMEAWEAEFEPLDGLPHETTTPS